MRIKIGNRGWFCLAVLLSLTSLGPYRVIWLWILATSLFISFLCVAMVRGYERLDILSRREQEGNPFLVFRPPNVGLPCGIESRSRKVNGFGDTRITGSYKVDAPINDIINYIFRDYVNPWYDEISSDPEFLNCLRVLIQKFVARAAQRAKDSDWIDFLTSKVVDDFASHIKLFRKAQMSLKQQQKVTDEDLYDTFFNLESEMEKRCCRDVICLDKEARKAYLKEIIDFVLFLLIDPQDFHNKAFRVITKEILLNFVIIPSIDKITEAEFVNQTISWLCEESSLNNESFLTVVKTTDNAEELEAVKIKVEQDISFHRSQDTAGKGKDSKIEDTKQTLRSLEFLLKICESRLVKLKAPGPQEGEDEGDGDSLFEGELSRYLQPGCVLYSVPLEIVLGSNRALSYFIDFLSDPSDPRQHYVFFYLATEAFKAQYQVEMRQEEDAFDHHLLKYSAQSIFDQYLSEKAFPRLELMDLELLTKDLCVALKKSTIPIDLFEPLQEAVYEKLDKNSKFYPKFKKQEAYVQLLADFDLLGGDVMDDGENGHQDGDGSVHSLESLHSASDCVGLNSSFELHQPALITTSMPQSRSAQFLNASLATAASITKSPSFQRKNQPTHFYALEAKIVETVICDGEPGKSSYAIYIIKVTKSSTLGESQSWRVGRRYSDFDELQRMLKKKFDAYSIVLPGKNFNRFSNMNATFLEKRRLALDVYLHTILSQEMLRKFLGSMEIIETFLSEGWDRALSSEQHQIGDRLSAAADSVIGSAIKNPFKVVTNTVRAFPLQLVKGVKDVGEGVKEASDSVKVGLDKLLKRGPGVGDFSVSTARVFDSLNVKGVALLGDTGRVGEGLSDEENIPLRITLLLFDEIFDLGSNQWLRRRMVAFLRQIIKATFGDMINKKIIDYMESYITPTQIADYLKQLRDSFWPEGLAVESLPSRDFATNQRLRVLTKAKMLGSLSDDLKRFIGNDTSKRGILRLFEMFQHQTLNQRLLFVFFEGILKTMFAGNKFEEIFEKIYGHSPRIKKQEFAHRSQ